MYPLRIERIDVRRIDEDALELLKSRMDPKTKHAVIKISEMTRLLRCGTTTGNRVVRRLEAAGMIRRHHKQGRSGADIEVLCPPSKNTDST